MSNLYALRAKWAAVHRDSFTADMHSTQRSKGMNNVFKKTFRRKLGISELLVECEKVVLTLRSMRRMLILSHVGRSQFDIFQICQC
jgi:hypothetical protein